VRGRRRVSFDAILLAATSIVLLLVIMSSAYSAVAHIIRAAASYDMQAAPAISVTVKPGDTLWNFARTYGAPGDNVLDNVESIAAANHLDSAQALVPGESLSIPVRNPAIVARLGLRAPGNLIASRD
jgi:nucleoid-associated protein YgaU